MTKIFCDIADINLIKKFNKKKIVKGFTTNPSLMRKAGAKDYKSYSKKILKICKKKIVKGFTTNPSLMRKAGARDYKKYCNNVLKITKKPISFEVFADDKKSIIRQASKIKNWGKQIYVKIPVVNSKGNFLGKVINKMDLFKDNSYEMVLKKLDIFGVTDIIKIVKGSFDDTLPKLKDEKFSFALVDCDIGPSTVVVLKNIWPRMVKGGIMMFDDYNSENDWGLKKVVDDFVKRNNLELHQDVQPYIIK